MPFFQWFANRGRDATFSVEIVESDGETPILLAADDRVLVSVGRDDGDEPLLTCDSDAPGDANSVVSFTTGESTATFRLHKDDTAEWPPGAYVVEVAIIDSADDDAYQHIQSGCLNLLDSLEVSLD